MKDGSRAAEVRAVSRFPQARNEYFSISLNVTRYTRSSTSTNTKGDKNRRKEENICRGLK